MSNTEAQRRREKIKTGSRDPRPGPRTPIPDLPSEYEWAQTRMVAARKNFPSCTVFPVLVRHDLGALGHALDAARANWQGSQYGCNWSLTIYPPEQRIERGWRGKVQ